MARSQRVGVVEPNKDIGDSRHVLRMQPLGVAAQKESPQAAVPETLDRH